MGGMFVANGAGKGFKPRHTDRSDAVFSRRDWAIAGYRA